MHRRYRNIISVPLMICRCRRVNIGSSSVLDYRCGFAGLAVDAVRALVTNEVVDLDALSLFVYVLLRSRLHRDLNKFTRND